MPVLIDEMSAYCEKSGIAFSVCEGHQTAEIREMYDLPKDHCVDGYAISLVGRHDMSVRMMPDRVHSQKRYKKKSNNNIQKRGRREYYFDNKLVAVNRHKGTDQKADSLEEYMAKYAKAHTKAETDEHFKTLIVKPARRVYTFHKEGRICPFHIGDTVRYEKKNKIKGNTKVDTFVCDGIHFAKDENEAKVEHDGTKSKKMKFCRVLEAGCTPYVGYRKIKIA